MKVSGSEGSLPEPDLLMLRLAHLYIPSRSHPTMFTKQVPRPVDGLDPLSWPPRQRRSSELEERPRHGPDPRLLCPTAFTIEVEELLPG
jgi:hypothetical protein